MLLTEETALVVLLAELLLPLLRDDCKEEATTVPRGLVVLRDTTLALVLPLRVVPLLVDLVDDDDAGDACPDEAPELLRVGGVGLAVAAEEDTETEQKQRKRNRAVKKNSIQNKAKRKLKVLSNKHKKIKRFTYRFSMMM